MASWPSDVSRTERVAWPGRIRPRDRGRVGHRERRSAYVADRSPAWRHFGGASGPASGSLAGCRVEASQRVRELGGSSREAPAGGRAPQQLATPGAPPPPPDAVPAEAGQNGTPRTPRAARRGRGGAGRGSPTDPQSCTTSEKRSTRAGREGLEEGSYTRSSIERTAGGLAEAAGTERSRRCARGKEPSRTRRRHALQVRIARRRMAVVTSRRRPVRCVQSSPRGALLPITPGMADRPGAQDYRRLRREYGRPVRAHTGSPWTS